MALNAIVDTPSTQGVPMYRNAFLGADYMAVNPDKAGIIKRLEVAIDELVSCPSSACSSAFAYAPYVHRCLSLLAASSCMRRCVRPRWLTSTIPSSAVSGLCA